MSVGVEWLRGNQNSFGTGLTSSGCCGTPSATCSFWALFCFAEKYRQAREGSPPLSSSLSGLPGSLGSRSQAWLLFWGSRQSGSGRHAFQLWLQQSPAVHAPGPPKPQAPLLTWLLTEHVYSTVSEHPSALPGSQDPGLASFPFSFLYITSKAAWKNKPLRHLGLGLGGQSTTSDTMQVQVARHPVAVEAFRPCRTPSICLTEERREMEGSGTALAYLGAPWVALATIIVSQEVRVWPTA